MDSQDISFSDVVPHQYEDDEEPFQYASQHSNLDMPEDNEVADENEFIDENVTLDAEENESPSKRSRKYKSEVKKVVSKWLLFSGEQRPKVMKEFPHFQFADIAGEVASRYRNISPEDSERLDAIVALDKERYKQELAEAVDDAPRSKASTSGGASELPTSTLAFPLSKVRRACKADPDTKNINKDALPLITKAVELFVGFLARKCAHTVSLRGVRQIKDTDVIQTIHMTEMLDFLRVDFPRKAVAPKPAVAPKLRIPSAPSSTSAVIGSGNGVVKKAGRPAAAQAPPVAAGKGIDKFFGGAKATSTGATSPVGVSVEGKRSREEREDVEGGDVEGVEGVEGVEAEEDVVEGEDNVLEEQKVGEEEDDAEKDVFAADDEE